MSRAATSSVRGSRRWPSRPCFAQLASVRPGRTVRRERRGTGGNTLDRRCGAGAGVAMGLRPCRRSAKSAHARRGGISASPSGPIAWPAPRGPPRGRMCLVRILLWHGYLLGGTGSNVYTRQLAREWSRAGHDVTVLSQEPSARGLRPRWRGDRAARRCRLPAGVRARPLRGLRRRPPGSRLHAGGARAMGRRERGGRPRAPARRPRLRQPRAARRPGRGRDGGAVRRQGARLGARVRDARAPGPRRLGRAVARGRARDVRRLGAHPRRASSEVCGPSRACTRCRPGSTSSSGAPRSASDALAALLDEARARRAEPRERRRAPARRRERGTARAVPRGRAAHRRLLRQADRAEGRPRPARRAARASTPASWLWGSGRSAQRSRRAPLRRGVRALFTGPLEHRHLRHLLALADACVVPSVFPEAFGMVAAEAAAAGCPPVVSRHSGLAEVAAELEAALPPRSAPLVSFPAGDAGALHERLAVLLALPAADRAALRSTVRRVVEERWSWAGIAQRLLELADVARLAIGREASSSLPAPWVSRPAASRTSGSSRRPTSASSRRWTSRSPSRRSSRSSTPRRSTSSTASRTCRRRCAAPRSSRISSAS